MRQAHYPVGLVVDVTYPMFNVTLHLEAENRLRFVIPDGPYAHEETVTIEVVGLSTTGSP